MDGIFPQAIRKQGVFMAAKSYKGGTLYGDVVGGVWGHGKQIYMFTDASAKNTIRIDQWTDQDFITAYNSMSANKVNTSNWNKDFAQIRKGYEAAMARQNSQTQQDSQVAALNRQTDAYEQMMRMQMEQAAMPAVEPMKNVDDQMAAARSSVKQQQQGRQGLLSLLSQSRFGQKVGASGSLG